MSTHRVARIDRHHPITDAERAAVVSLTTASVGMGQHGPDPAHGYQPTSYTVGDDAAATAYRTARSGPGPR